MVYKTCATQACVLLKAAAAAWIIAVVDRIVALPIAVLLLLQLTLQLLLLQLLVG